MKLIHLKKYTIFLSVFLMGLLMISIVNCEKLPFLPELNKKPIPDFEAIIQERTLTVRFDASTSRDEDGKIVKYEWKFGDLTTGEGMTTFNSYAVSGTYVVG